MLRERIAHLEGEAYAQEEEIAKNVSAVVYASMMAPGPINTLI